MHRRKALAEHRQGPVELRGERLGGRAARDEGGFNAAIANDAAKARCDCSACSAIAFQDSPKALFFSAIMRVNSLRSRADSCGPAWAIRSRRWATTCGTASASSAVLADSERDERGRRAVMDLPVRSTLAPRDASQSGADFAGFGIRCISPQRPLHWRSSALTAAGSLAPALRRTARCCSAL